jgi:hypothetical protein
MFRDVKIADARGIFAAVFASLCDEVRAVVL